MFTRLADKSRVDGKNVSRQLPAYNSLSQAPLDVQAQ